MVGTAYENGTADRDPDGIGDWPPVNIADVINAGSIKDPIPDLNGFNTHLRQSAI